MVELENSTTDTTLDAESFQQKVSELFEQYTDSETIHKNDLLDLLDDLGFTVSIDQLKAVVINELGLGEMQKGQKDPKIPSIFDYEDTVGICMYFFQNNSVRHGIDEEGSRLIDQEVEFHQYLWMIVTGSRQKDVNYIVVRPRFLHISFTPKKVLVLGAASVMIIMCILVVLVLSLLWLQNTHTDERNYAQRSVDKLQVLMDEFENRNNSLLREVISETEIISGLFEASARHVVSQNKKFYSHLLQTWAVASQIVFQKPQNEGQTLVATLQTVIAAVRAASTASRSSMDVYEVVAPIILSQRRAAVGNANDWDVVVQNVSDGQTLLKGVSTCEADGTCSYAQTCVMLEESTTPVVVDDTFVPLGPNVRGATVSCYIPTLMLTVCYFKSASRFQQSTKESIGNVYQSMFSSVSCFEGKTLNLVTLDQTTHKLTHHTPLQTVGPLSTRCTGTHHCENGAIRSLVKAVAGNCSQGNCVMPLYTTEAYDNSSSPVMCAIASYGYPSITNGALVVCQSSSDVKDSLGKDLIKDINTINTLRVATGTEYVIATRNETTGSVNAQATDYVNANECFGGCMRFAAAAVGQLAVLTQNVPLSYGIAPDYRPQPVSFAYTKVPATGASLGTERTVVNYRWNIQQALLKLVESLNDKFEHMSIVPVTNQAHYVPMSRYNPFAACGTGNTCIERAGIGVVYRSDCVDCTRGSLLVAPYVLGTCHGPCEAISHTPLYNQPFSGPLNVIEKGQSYAGTSSLYSALRVNKLGLGLVMHFYTSARDHDVRRLIVIAVLVCIGLFTVALGLFFVASQDNLNKVEKDWITYRKSITKQSEDFSKIVGDVVPPVYAPFLFVPNAAVSEKLNITTVFLNFVGFQRLIADQDADFVHDYISYSFFVMNTVTRYYKMFKVKTFGDNFMIVGGVSRNLATRAAAVKKMGIVTSITDNVVADNIDDDEDASITRCVEAAAVLMQLFSYQYTHHPQHINFLRKRIKMKEITDLGLLRIGIATGPTNLIMTRHDGFPFFLALGEPAACSYRLQQGTKTNTINISKDVKNALVRTGFDSKLTFGHDRVVTHKKIVFTASAIHMADVPIPKQLLTALKVTRAPCRMYYSDEGKLVPVGIPLGGLAPTVGQSSDRSTAYHAGPSKSKPY